MKFFLVKGKSEILKFFSLYDVIILVWNTSIISSDPIFIEWHVRCTFETFISLSFLKQEMRESLLYRNHIKIFSFQNGKHGYLMQYLTRQSFEGHCCESEYNLYLFLIF